MSIIYTAHATSTGGRQGHAETDDKKVSVDLSAPGSGGAGTNPEQLFACGYGACFGGALAFLAKQKKLDIGNPEVKVDVNLHRDDSGFSLSAAIDVTLSNLDFTSAEQLVRETHEFCPYSKATRGNIDVKLTVNQQPVAKAA